MTRDESGNLTSDQPDHPFAFTVDLCDTFLVVALIKINTIRSGHIFPTFPDQINAVGEALTKNFIRKPFLLYGIWHGLLGALIAIVILMGTLYVAQKEVPDLVILQDYTEFGIVFFLVVGLGIFISGFSTVLAVNKYLRLKIYNLYR